MEEIFDINGVRGGIFHRAPIGVGEIPNLEILRLLHGHNHFTSVNPKISFTVNDVLGEGNKICAQVMPSFEAIQKDI